MIKSLENFFEKKESYENLLPKRQEQVVIYELKRLLRELNPELIFERSLIDYCCEGAYLKASVYQDEEKEIAMLFKQLINESFKAWSEQTKGFSQMLQPSRGETRESEIDKLNEDDEIEFKFLFGDLHGEWGSSYRITAKIEGYNPNQLNFYFNTEDINSEVKLIVDRERGYYNINNDALCWVFDKMESHYSEPLKSFGFYGTLKKEMMQDIIDWLSDNIGGIVKESQNEIISVWEFSFFKLTITTNIHSLKSSFEIEELPSFFDKELFDYNSDYYEQEDYYDDNQTTYGDHGFDSRAAHNDFFGIDDNDQYDDDY